ncbi:retrovirus-related pol polyprotein from transposon TNT 1-94 [Tanacetum coccineum]
MWRSIEKGPYKRPMIPNPNNTTERILEPLSKMTKGRRSNTLLMFSSDVTSHVRQSRLMDEFDKLPAKEGESLESIAWVPKTQKKWVPKTQKKWVPKTQKKWVPKVRNESVPKRVSFAIVQLILFIVDSGCTKHMTGNVSLLCNFVEKYLGTVRFGNDQFAPILGYGDLVQGNITIKRVYYVEGLNHNLFSVGQFCDADLEVAFRKSTCFVRDLQGNDLLTGNRGSDLYTISLQDTTSSTPICLMAKASPTQAWLWHRRLSHLNFDYINLLSKKDIVIGLPKLKYVKDHLCSSCEVSKAKRSSFKSKTVPSSKGRLNLLHMDLCGPMRVASINGKKYILVIVDDYSRYTWTLFLRSKDETPEVLKEFLTMIQRNLQAPVISVRTDRGTEFLNKTLNAFFKEEGIEHQTSTPRTPEQNGVVERRNRTLVEAARTMLSASKLPLFFWAEAIATACYTQNRSIIIPTHEKTAYHIINDRKPSIKHLHIFGCTCAEVTVMNRGVDLWFLMSRGFYTLTCSYDTSVQGSHNIGRCTSSEMDFITHWPIVYDKGCVIDQDLSNHIEQMKETVMLRWGVMLASDLHSDLMRCSRVRFDRESYLYVGVLDLECASEHQRGSVYLGMCIERLSEMGSYRSKGGGREDFFSGDEGTMDLSGEMDGSC